MAKQRLTDKQQAFISHYIMTMNATEAAARAGYGGDRRTLAAIGCENLAKPKIAAEIRAKLNALAMSAEEVLARLTDHARGSMGDFLKVTDAGKPSISLKEAQQDGRLHLVKKIKIRPGEHGTEIELELYDAQNALNMLGRYHKLFTDRTEVSDWRSDLIAGIRAGEIDYELLFTEMGRSLADELFELAGVPISRGPAQS